MRDDIANFALSYAQKKGASYVEARLEKTESHSLLMKNGALDVLGMDQYEGIGIRFLFQNTLGFVSTNELERKKIKNIIDRALKVTKIASIRSEKICFSHERAYHGAYQSPQQIPISQVSIEQKIQLLQDADEAMRETKVPIAAAYLSYNDNDTEELYLNTDGARIKSRIPRYHLYYFLTCALGLRSTQRYWVYGGSGGWEVVKKWNVPNILSNEVKAMSLALHKGKRAPQETLPIVCGPQVTGIMVHESAGHPYEADRILGREIAQAGGSFVTTDMIGKKIGSDVVSIVDDPSIINSYGFYQYDHEGVKARKRTIIKKGIITELFHNRETAHHLGISSNASARAGNYTNEPLIRMGNTYMVPGDYSEEELFDGVKKGIYLKNFMEWNIDDQRMNQKYTGSEAYLIENGELTQPLFHPVLEVSTLKLYPSIDAVGKNLEMHAGSCGKGEPMQSMPIFLGGPSIRIQGLRVK